MKNKSQKILIFRFSALGDIAMTIPVVTSLLKAYPEKELVFVSRPYVSSLFKPINRIHFIAFDPKGEHKGLRGLWRLFLYLRSLGPYSFVADLHDVFRSWILDLFFIFSGTPVYKINKGRRAKKALTRQHNKVLKPLKTTFERYQDVFIKGGLPFSLDDFDGRPFYSLDFDETLCPALKGEALKIGIAPFTAHPWKTWPSDKIQDLMLTLAEKGYQIFLLGGRGTEQIQLEHWATRHNNIHNLAGKLPIEGELKAISLMDIVVSMDSANMHLASLVKIPVVSIWGATHPYVGFYGWGQDPENAVQVDLDCRPCSVYGNKPCYRSDFACMNNISTTMVLQKIERLIGSK